jgi:hypothetical protein
VAIDEVERARRAELVQSVRTSTALEGGRASASVEALQDEWVAGLITFDEFGAAVRRLHPSTADTDESLSQ